MLNSLKKVISKISTFTDTKSVSSDSTVDSSASTINKEDKDKSKEKKPAPELKGKNYARAAAYSIR